ncbi:MAG: hypothetical protein IPI50_04400 [Saprospiraceae bacterium]|nr:hypothetical protein [Saprospiraceae bacterium]
MQVSNLKPFYPIKWIRTFTQIKFRKSYFIVLFLSQFLLAFTSCKQDLPNPNSSSLKNKSFDWSAGVISCPGTDCVEYSCFCFQANCCDRYDLDPCDSTDMGKYAIGVARELCKATSSCLQKSFSIECEPHSDSCYDFSFLPYNFFTEDPDGNPFHYCSNADCNGTHYCEDLGPTFYLHRPMTIALQNQIAAHVIYLANQYRPRCNPAQFGLNCFARVGDIFYSVCTDPDKSGCETLEDPCWDTKIIIRFEYWCCPCSI